MSYERAAKSEKTSQSPENDDQGNQFGRTEQAAEWPGCNLRAVSRVEAAQFQTFGNIALPYDDKWLVA